MGSELVRSELVRVYGNHIRYSRQLQAVKCNVMRWRRPDLTLLRSDEAVIKHSMQACVDVTRRS